MAPGPLGPDEKGPDEKLRTRIGQVTAGALWHGPKHTAVAAWTQKGPTAAGFAVVAGVSAGAHRVGLDPHALLAALSGVGLGFDIKSHLPRIRAAQTPAEKRRLIGELITKPLLYGGTVAGGGAIAHGADSSVLAATASGVVTAGDGPIFVSTGLSSRQQVAAAKKAAQAEAGQNRLDGDPARGNEIDDG